MKLTEHFDLEEFTRSDTAVAHGIDNSTPGAIMVKLGRLARTLEKVRAILGHPLQITSGYRCPALNAAVGGVGDSAHLYGLAADILCPGFGTPLEVCRELEKHAQELDYDQLIHEHFGAADWTHFGLRDDVSRRMAFTMDGAGTRIGFA